MPLDRTLLNKIKVKDRTMSTVLTIFLPIAIIGGAALIFQDSFGWKSGNLFEGSDFQF